MPLEPSLRKPIESQWSFSVVSVEDRTVAFRDESYGKIEKWHWDFGDGSSSTDQHPLHRFEKPGEFVVVLTVEGPAVQRELALLKVSGKGDARIEALRLAEIFRANVVDSTLESFVFEMTGTPEKIDAFADLMRPLGLREIALGILLRVLDGLDVAHHLHHTAELPHNSFVCYVLVDLPHQRRGLLRT